MAITQTPDQKQFEFEYELGLPSFRFSTTSPKAMSLSQGVKYAARQPGMVLQSLAEAATLRLVQEESQKKDMHRIGQDQLTRTAGIAFDREGQDFIAFDDTPDAKKNIVLARAKEGLAARKYCDHWVVNRYDQQVVEHIERARRNGRIIPVDKEALQGYTELIGLDYADEIFGGSIGTKFDNYWRTAGHEGLRVGIIPVSELRLDPKTQVIVQPMYLNLAANVSLDWDLMDSLPLTSAHVRAFARGVQHDCASSLLERTVANG